MQDCYDLIALFNREFSDYNTELVAGGSEPLYTPPCDGLPARIVFRDDYLRSALHEIAHWVIAGARRRQLEDYGYWYEPDGRSAQQQAAFEKVEVLPQAIEKKFCEALQLPFRVSVDNLNAGSDADDSAFAASVDALAATLTRDTMPTRAWRFVQALRANQALSASRIS